MDQWTFAELLELVDAIIELGDDHSRLGPLLDRFEAGQISVAELLNETRLLRSAASDREQSSTQERDDEGLG